MKVILYLNSFNIRWVSSNEQRRNYARTKQTTNHLFIDKKWPPKRNLYLFSNTHLFVTSCVTQYLLQNEHRPKSIEKTNLPVSKQGNLCRTWRWLWWRSSACNLSCREWWRDLLGRSRLSSASSQLASWRIWGRRRRWSVPVSGRRAGGWAARSRPPCTLLWIYEDYFVL